MKFFYKAIKPDGRIVEGEVEALNQNEAVVAIASKGLKPITLKQQKKNSFTIPFFKGQRITLEDKVFITKYLSLMLKVGTDLYKAIDILIEDFDKPAVKSLLLEIRSNLERGQPFYTTFAHYPKTFSPVFVNLVKSGEVSGNLERVFDQLSTSLESEQELMGKIKSSLTYPIILFVGAIVVLVLLVSYSLPKIANVFMQGNANPPAFSKTVFTIGLFIGDHLTIILSLLVILGGGGTLFFLKTMAGKKIMYEIALHIPIIKKVIKQTSIQRFATTFASLLGSGIGIVEALDITSDAASMPELKTALSRIAHEGIAKGLTVGDAFRREQTFPKIVSNLIAVSEKSGHIENIMQTLADFYKSEIESSVKSLVSFIEPVLLLFIGVIVGAIALAIIIPVYQLTSTF